MHCTCIHFLKTLCPQFIYQVGESLPSSPVYNNYNLIDLNSHFYTTVDINIAVNPETDIVEGNNVTLWCNAQSSSVANLTSYSWQNSQGQIVSDRGRINITLHNGSYNNNYGVFIFNSSLTFSPLLPSDGDRYICNLTIGLPQVGVNISNTTTRAIRVSGKTNPCTINKIM